MPLFAIVSGDTHLILADTREQALDKWVADRTATPAGDRGNMLTLALASAQLEANLSGQTPPTTTQELLTTLFVTELPTGKADGIWDATALVEELCPDGFED